MLAFVNKLRDAGGEYTRALVMECNSKVLHDVYMCLNKAIDMAESIEMNTIYIRQGYNEQLDHLRSIYDNLEDTLTAAAKDILEQSPLLNSVAVEYVPQLGYLAVVNETDKQLLDYGNFTFVYELNGKAYLKNRVVLEMDDKIGDIKSMVSDLQKTILISIEEYILDAEMELVKISHMLGNLDAIISLGTVAVELNFCKPEIVEEQVIIIKNGRHPLQELSVDVFIPNDTYIAEGKNVAIITGENGSGKSVYLKQGQLYLVKSSHNCKLHDMQTVGLLVYLAHIGSWIPCERAIIGLTDKIFSRISSVESSFSPHSAFSMDLCQMSNILRSHTSQSLCLIDEFGKRSDYRNGTYNSTFR
jgi:DNA mismatch repair protein MSH5